MSSPSGRASAPVPVILALGSNVGDRRAHLERGIDFLGRRVQIVRVSRVVESRPWGPIAQGDFLNLVLRAESPLGPFGLLELLQQAEADAGRDRVIPQGPRTLDVDLVFFGELRLDEPGLVVPHPHWRERPFVADLVGEVAGTMTDPASGRPLREVVPPGSLSEGLREVPPLALGGHVRETLSC